MDRSTARTIEYAVKHPRVTELTTLLDWFATRRRPPTWQDVVTRFECSRPTAFRWLALYRHIQAENRPNLNNQQPPARNLSGSQYVSAPELKEMPDDAA
jgi:hypothetical protein